MESSCAPREGPCKGSPAGIQALQGSDCIIIGFAGVWRAGLSNSFRTPTLIRSGGRAFQDV